MIFQRGQKYIGLGLWFLTPLSTIFHYIMAVSFIGELVSGGNHRSAQVTDKLYHINVVSSTPRLSGVRTHNVNGDRH